MLLYPPALPQLELTLSLLSSHYRLTSKHGYDVTIVISVLRYTQSGTATPKISWFRLFERVVHCPLILDFSCIYAAVHGESHGHTPHDHKFWLAD